MSHNKQNSYSHTFWNAEIVAWDDFNKNSSSIILEISCTWNANKKSIIWQLFTKPWITRLPYCQLSCMLNIESHIICAKCWYSLKWFLKKARIQKKSKKLIEHLFYLTIGWLSWVSCLPWTIVMHLSPFFCMNIMVSMTFHQK